MSTGLRVLSSKDDAAGAAISTKTRVELDGLNIANNNLQTSNRNKQTIPRRPNNNQILSVKPTKQK